MVIDKYRGLLKEIDGICIFDGNSTGTKNYSYFPILVTDTYPGGRNGLYNRLKDHGSFSRKYFYPVTSDQACFKNKYKNIDISNARKLSEQVLVLPLYEELSGEQVEFICSIIKGGR